MQWRGWAGSSRKSLRHSSHQVLKLISKRDAYMFNSWYANVAEAEKQRTGTATISLCILQDAQARQIPEGEPRCGSRTSTAAIEAPVKLSDDLMSGVVAMSHGWGQGQSKGMRVASGAPGVNCNAAAALGSGQLRTTLQSVAHDRYTRFPSARLADLPERSRTEQPVRTGQLPVPGGQGQNAGECQGSARPLLSLQRLC